LKALSYFTLLLIGIISARTLPAQVTNQLAFDSVVWKMEIYDSVGLEQQLRQGAPVNSTDEEQLWNQLAYCYVVLYAGRQPLDRTELEECFRLDSLVHNDTLHEHVQFMHGYYYFMTYNYDIALELLNTSALAYGNKAQSMVQARCFMIRGLIQQALSYPEEAEKSMLVALAYYQE
jgi:hypothetical protein